MQSRQRVPRRAGFAAWLMLISAVIVAGEAAAANAAPAWRSIWSTSPSNALTSTALAPNEAIRQIVHVSASGNTLRLRFTQRYGYDTAGLSVVSIGRRATASATAGGAAIEPGTLRAVTFNGQRAVRIPAGATVISDPVDLSVNAFDDLVVSFAGSQTSVQLTEHAISRSYSYIGLGAAAVDSLDDGSYRRSPSGMLDAWFLLDGIDAAQTAVTRTLVAAGDSITDGYVSTGGSPLLPDNAANDRNERYPDFLAQRLALRFPGRYSVVNAGISGNRVTAGPFLPDYGPSLLNRLDEDVLAIPGVTDVLLSEGGNDIGFGRLGTAPDAQGLIDGLTQAVTRIKAAHLRVVLGTIPPMRGAFAGPLGAPGVPGNFGFLHGSAQSQIARVAVNAWIRTQTLSDGVVDFDACLRDPDAPEHLAPAYDSGDHLHPNPAGYAAMANCVDLSLLQ